jgi:hypothetical protein
LPLLGVFLSVLAVVLGIAGTLEWKAHHRPVAVQTSTAAVRSLPLRSQVGPAPGSLMSRIPDTSVVAGDTALHSKPGTLVASGKGFRVERVALARPVRAQVDGRSLMAHSVLRLTITAGTWVPRDLAPVVWLDGRPLAIGMESSDLAGLTAFTFDESLLVRGAKVQVGYGLPETTTATWTSTVEEVQ